MDPIERAVAQAREQHQAEQMFEAMLRQTLAQPHTTERIDICLLAMRDEGDGYVLAIASPDGRRRDIVLTEQMAGSIAAAVGRRTAEKLAAAAEPVAA